MSSRKMTIWEDLTIEHQRKRIPGRDTIEHEDCDYDLDTDTDGDLQLKT